MKIVIVNWFILPIIAIYMGDCMHGGVKANFIAIYRCLAYATMVTTSNVTQSIYHDIVQKLTRTELPYACISGP